MSEGKTYCNGEHRLHVAADAIVEAEGKVCIIALCLNCGQGFMNEHVVTKNNSSIQLTKKEN